MTTQPAPFGLREIAFELPAGYEARPMRLVLSRERRGWSFYGRDKNGYCVPALDARTRKRLAYGEPVFPTVRQAQRYAEGIIRPLPPFAIWNGRKRAYDEWDSAFETMAEPRA